MTARPEKHARRPLSNPNPSDAFNITVEERIKTMFTPTSQPQQTLQSPQPEEVEHLDIPAESSPTLAHPIRVRSRPISAGVRIARHTHSWAQVACTTRGVLRIAAEGSTWMVPPSRAIWVPPNVTHEVVIVEDAFLRTLYIDESVVPPG